MNLRRFFTQQAWWGKLIGAFFGYLIAGPIGIFFGLLIGNFFDRGLNQYYSNPYWYYRAEKRKPVQIIFFEATFSIMGHLAKADGRVSEEAILMAKELMYDLDLDNEQQKSAQRLFNEGKKINFNLQQIAVKLYRATKSNTTLLKLFVDIQYRAAQLGGMSDNKLRIMNSMLNELHFATLYKQNRFYEDFAYHAYKKQSGRQHSSSNDHYQAYHSTQSPMASAFAILEIKPTANKQDVKRAYRRLMSRNHPDKLIAQGLPEKMIKIANEKTQNIRKAYEEICASRGWS